MTRAHQGEDKTIPEIPESKINLQRCHENGFDKAEIKRTKAKIKAYPRWLNKVSAKNRPVRKMGRNLKT